MSSENGIRAQVVQTVIITAVLGGIVAWTFFDAQTDLATINANMSATQSDVSEIKTEIRAVTLGMSSHAGSGPHPEQRIFNQMHSRRLDLLEGAIKQVRDNQRRIDHIESQINLRNNH